MTPEERRKVQVGAISGFAYSSSDGIAAICVRDAKDSLDYLLACFDETEPAVANAIRYGLKESGRYVMRTEPSIGGGMTRVFGIEYRIDYPPDQTDGGSK